MSYVTPQVKVYQEFTSSPSASEGERRAWIVGPNAILHRYNDVDEKPNTLLGSVLEDNITDVALPYPGKESAGSNIDTTYVKVFADNAKLRYFNIDGVAYNVVDTPNAITFKDYNDGAGLNLITNGSNLRDAVFGDRDVQIGDTIRLTAYTAEGTAGSVECEEKVFESVITDFLPTMTEPTLAAAAKEPNTALYGTGTPTVTAVNPDQGTVAGITSEAAYSIAVTAVADTAITYVVTDLLTGNESDPAETTLDTSNGTAFTIATGKTLTLTLTAAPAAGTKYYVIASETYGAVQSTITPTSDNTNVALAVTGTFKPYKYGRLSSDFVVKVTKTTNTPNCKSAEVTVTSSTGIRSGIQVPLGDTAGNTGSFYLDEDKDLTGTFTGKVSDLTVGDTYTFSINNKYSSAVVGATGRFTGDEDTVYIITCLEGGILGTSNPVVSIASSDGEEFFSGKLSTSVSNGVITATVRMPRGITFTFYGVGDNKEIAENAVYSVEVTASANGPVQTLQLKDSLPYSFRTWDEEEKNLLNVEFCVIKNVELASDQYTATNESIRLNDPITVVDPEFDSLTLVDADVYVQYREWVTQNTNVLTIVSSLEEINAIPGQLDPDNILKYGVYKAFANSNGTSVAYTAVAINDEADLDAWSEAFATGSGSTEIFTLVPLTQNIAIQNAAKFTINTDSNEDVCAWKRAIFNTTVDTERVIAAVRGVVLQNATTGEYTRVVLNPENTPDISEVKPGDVVRVMYRSVLTEYVINEVVSATELSLLSGPDSQIGLGTEQGGNLTFVAMWLVHKMTRADQVAEICRVAGSFSSRRIELVWPDKVGEGGVWMPGYFLCAAIAGLMSGVQPHQGLTHVEVSGFDDFSRSAPYFTPAQIKQLAAGGVWVCLTSKENVPYTYHAVTTDMSDLNTQEEMITRNMDAISLYFSDLLKPYIGTTNTTDEFLEQLNLVIQFACENFSIPVNNSIGPRIMSYSIDSVERDALLRDHVRVLLTVELPMATNVISLYIYA